MELLIYRFLCFGPGFRRSDLIGLDAVSSAFFSGFQWIRTGFQDLVLVFFRIWIRISSDLVAGFLRIWSLAFLGFGRWLFFGGSGFRRIGVLSDTKMYIPAPRLKSLRLAV